MNSHYFTTPLVRLGRWTLYPADTESWHAEDTSLKYFKRAFGFPKCLLMFCRLDDGSQFPYAPAALLKKLYRYIETTTRRDYRALERKLRPFYKLKAEFARAVPRLNPPDLSVLTNHELIRLYRKNRDFAHRIAVYDQFGW